MKTSSPVRIVSGLQSDPVRIVGPLPSYPNIVTVGSNLSDYTSIQDAINSINNASESNPYQINVSPGTYTEDLSTKEWVNIIGQSARIVGNHTVGDNVKIVIREMTASSGTIITKSGVGLATLIVDRLTVPDSSIGVVNTTITSILFLDVRRLFVGTGSIGLGDAATGFGHTHLRVNDLYLAGTGAVGVVATGSKRIVGYIDHILELGSPGSTTGLFIVSNGEVQVSANEITADTAYNVDATSRLDLNVGLITGTRTQAAGAVVRENGMPTTNPGPGLVWSNNGVPTVGT